MTDLEPLKKAIARLEKKAAPHGSMHPLWDVIFTGRSIVCGGSFWPYESEDRAIQDIIKSSSE